MRNDAAAHLISPPPGGHLPPLYHTQVMFLNIYIQYIYSQCCDRQIKNTSSEIVCFGHTNRIWRTEHSFIFGQICRIVHFPDVLYWLSLASNSNVKAHSDDPSQAKCLLPREHEPHGVISVAIGNCFWVIMNIWGCDDSLHWEVSCSVGGLLSHYLCSGNWLLDLTRRTMSQLCQGQQDS